MQQVDIETVVLSRNSSRDNRISCETSSVSGPLDFPPDSFCISKDEEQDWLENNAFIERKNSAKRSCTQPASNLGSQRFSLNFKSKASLIGFPKPHKNSFIDPKNRKKCDTRLFPKRTGSMAEPASPKVSCMGRVRSKRKRNCRVDGKRRTGFFAKCRAIFGRKKMVDHVGEVKDDKHDILKRLPASEVDGPRRSEADSEPVGLGGMRRFVSGRRSDSWVDADVARL